MEWDLVFFTNSLLLGVGLAMDAFSVSMANGLRPVSYTHLDVYRDRGNTEVRTLVSGMVYEKLTEFFEENPAVAKAIFEKATQAARARAWKACIPQKGIRGSNPRLSAGKNCKTKKSL